MLGQEIIHKRFKQVAECVSMRVSDFFCGAGGFSEGFRQAGFEICFAVDKWEPAINTYAGNKPGVNVIQDDVIRISQLNDEEFEQLVPDTEVIIGSPPCQAFSSSNKSGNGDKSLGIQLIEAYLRIIARKRFKDGSILKYWVLENVPNVKNYIKESYSAEDLGLPGNFVLFPNGQNSGLYNAKYFGAPTNRERYLCGEFPCPQKTHDDESAITLRKVLTSLREPLSKCHDPITDLNYPKLILPNEDISDHHYIYELQPFEWEKAKRLKQDKGYMGRMAFPENLDRPSRTVMANMSASSRESMILGYGNNQYRLPTVREVATMMSFPIDYRFYGPSKGVKYTLVGNSVPPKLSYAIAIAILRAEHEPIPVGYPKIVYNNDIPFINLNHVVIPPNVEKPKREVAKFKYHIPYLIINAFRVELTNYYSDFDHCMFKWNVELHYSQGKDKAKIYYPTIDANIIEDEILREIDQWIDNINNFIPNFQQFQKVFCMTTIERNRQTFWGPYQLLNEVRALLDRILSDTEKKTIVGIKSEPHSLPYAIAIGYYILEKIIKSMEGK